MTVLVAWLVFPVVLALLALGCGLLLEESARIRLPGALLLPVGLAVIIVVAEFATAADATAELAVPLVAAMAAAGFAFSPPWRRGRVEPWAAGAAVVVFACYAAPVVLSGEATLAGYIKLDDASTWLALTDRVMEHGRNLAGLAPSSYEASLDSYVNGGYPVGSFLPLGIGHALLSADSAWLYQPCMSFFAAMLALTLIQLAEPLVRTARFRAAIAVIAAQPALLFGYVMWGGIKEIAAAALLALVAATVPLAIGAGSTAAILPLAVACAALLAVLGPAGMVWLGPPLLAVLALAAVHLGSRVATRRAFWFAGVLAVLSVPLLTSGALEVATNSVLYAESELGNLLGPLNGFQAVGIWPVGDFRRSPVDGTVTALLIGLALIAAIAGLAWAVRARAAPLLLFCLGGLISVCAIVALGSPWVDAKGLATVAPAALLAVLVGSVGVYQAGFRAAGVLLTGVIAFGVLWSNALAYREVNLAPYDQLSELERIGERIAGQGPTLMTEYQPYGVRHFLRDSDPEGVSELRRRPIPLRGGGEVETGGNADTDELQLDGLLVYRSLVLRRSPEQSRPPFPYRLLDRRRFYEVWQRSPVPPPARVRHLSLGSEVQPTGYFRCGKVRRLAAAAGPDGQLAFAERPPNVVFTLSRFRHPAAWTDPGADTLLPNSAGSAALRIRLPSAGVWRVWLGGSVRGRIDLLIDGREAGSARHRVNYGFYIDFGQVRLKPGPHLVELRYQDADLHPGSAGPALPTGPLIFSSAESSDETVHYMPTSRADELCGRRLDWVEVLPG